MKAKIKLLTLGLMAVVGLGLMSCSDKETYDVRGINHNLMYISRSGISVTKCNIYTTPTMRFGDVTASVPVHTQYRTESSVKITAVADTSLTSTYNKECGATAIAVPAELASNIEVTPVEIKADTTSSQEDLVVTVPDEYIQNLTESDYVLPVRLVAEGASGERRMEASEMGVAYIAIHNNVLDKLVSLSNMTGSSTIFKTPSGYTGSINSSFIAKLAVPTKTDVTVSLEPAMNLVDTYNQANNTTYPALPDKVVSAVAKSEAVIAAGEREVSINVKSDNADYSAMKPTTYLLPLQMKAVYADGEVNPNENDVAYIFVTLEESNIQTTPTSISGKTVSDISAWKCIRADNFNPDMLRTSNYPPLAKKEEGEFVVDFGAVHNVTGFMRSSCAVASNPAKYYFSENGTDWYYPGTVSGKGTIKDANGNNCYVLNSPLKARYVKIHVYFDTGAFAWRYVNYKAEWAYNYFGFSWNVVFND